MRQADRLIGHFDDGSFFRRPWKKVYLILAYVFGAAAVVGSAGLVCGGAVFCYELYERKQYEYGVQGAELGLLAALAVLFLGLFVARIWWVRSKDLESHTVGYKVFIAGPIVAHIMRTLGEAAGAATALYGVLAFLTLWPASMAIGDIPFVGRYLRGFLSPSLPLLLLSPISGFLLIMVTRWMAEATEVMFAIANNTRPHRSGGEAQSAQAAPTVQIPAFRVHWLGLLIGLGCYMLLALPLNQTLIALPALLLLIVALTKDWLHAAIPLIAFTLIVLIRGSLAFAADQDPESVAQVFMDNARPLLVILLLLALVAICLNLAQLAGSLTSRLRLWQAWGIGSGLALLYCAYPAAMTIQEAMKRHELTEAEIKRVQNLFAEYEGRRFGWRMLNSVDTTATFSVEQPQFSADKYGLITVRHELNTNRRRMTTSFQCHYTAIRLPDSLIYSPESWPVVVRYLNNDSIGFSFTYDNGRTKVMAVALDLATQLDEQRIARRAVAFNAYRDSLHRQLDTLVGRFVSYECAEAVCFAWFDVTSAEGITKRSFYCPSPTLGGYPVNALPKDESDWRIIIRQTAIADEEALSTGAGPILYELRMIEPVAKAPPPPPATPNHKEVQSAPKIKEESSLVVPMQQKMRPYARSEVDQEPTYPGGRIALRDHLATRVYPTAEMNAGITARIRVQFIITAAGNIRDITFLDSPGYVNFETEAKRVISTMRPWIPGVKGGKPVDVRWVETIDFSLSD